jgi:hypothetical protein
MAVGADAAADARRLLEAVGGYGAVLALKLYRLPPIASPDIPLLPCLDHEAMLHEGIAPHAAAYVQEHATGDLHEIVYVPRERRLEIDTVSTYGEHTVASRDRLLTLLQTQFPSFRVRIHRPSWWRAERRVAEACRAQVSLRDVLLNPDLDVLKARVDRLATVGTIMEKHSRVASWGIRTVMSPLLGAVGVVLILVLGALEPIEGGWLAVERYGLLALLGGWFLYYGMKAVQLTDMGNRVWKRSAEYNLILAERKRIHSQFKTPRDADPARGHLDL